MHYAPYLPLSYMYSVLHSTFQNLTYEIAVLGLVSQVLLTIILHNGAAHIEIENTFFENIHLTNQNSLTHLFNFDEEHSYLSNVLKTFFYYTDAEFIQEMNSDSCTIMSLTCQSLKSNFLQIKLPLDKFAESDKPIHVLCLQETWIEDSELIDMAQFHIDNYH